MLKQEEEANKNVMNKWRIWLVIIIYSEENIYFNRIWLSLIFCQEFEELLSDCLTFRLYYNSFLHSV